MLDRNDKKWIIETVDGRLDTKLGETKTELRGEMQEMKTDIIPELTAHFTAHVAEAITRLEKAMQ